MRHITFTAEFLVTLLLVGCASEPFNKGLTPNTLLVKQSTHVVVGTNQSKINTLIDPSQLTLYMGGGLLPALIDAGINQSREQSAEEIVKPIRDALADFDFNSLAQRIAAQKLESIDVIHPLTIDFSREVNPEKYTKMMDSSTAPRMFYLNYDYLMNSDFTGVRVGLFAVLKPKTQPGGSPENRMGLGDTLFHKHYVTEMYLQTPADDISKRISVWSADNGDLLKKGLEWGLTAIADQLKNDLLKPTVDPGEGSAKLIRGFVGKIVYTNAPVQIISATDGSWVALKGISTLNQTSSPE